MPTIQINGPFRFFFYSADRDEPPHIHVERDKKRAKFWLDPVRIQNSNGFNRVELNKIQDIVKQNSKLLLKRRNEFFNS